MPNQLLRKLFFKAPVLSCLARSELLSIAVARFAVAAVAESCRLLCTAHKIIYFFIINYTILNTSFILAHIPEKR
ncbi:hypothetical protein DXA13_19965 [Clostridium sp. AM58-1XD]|nr:hypothetical protein DXA13_19965 [Clostridium sp. AM58-1XD]